MNKLNLKGVDKGTWVRIIGLFLILINQISISVFKFELIGFGDAEIYEGVSTILTVVISIYAGWMNNSITKEAQLADKIAIRKTREEH